MRFEGPLVGAICRAGLDPAAEGGRCPEVGRSAAVGSSLWALFGIERARPHRRVGWRTLGLSAMFEKVRAPDDLCSARPGSSCCLLAVRSRPGRARAVVSRSAEGAPFPEAASAPQSLDPSTARNRASGADSPSDRQPYERSSSGGAGRSGSSLSGATALRAWLAQPKGGTHSFGPLYRGFV